MSFTSNATAMQPGSGYNPSNFGVPTAPAWNINTGISAPQPQWQQPSNVSMPMPYPRPYFPTPALQPITVPNQVRQQLGLAKSVPIVPDPTELFPDVFGTCVNTRPIILENAGGSGMSQVNNWTAYNNAASSPNNQQVSPAYPYPYPAPSYPGAQPFPAAGTPAPTEAAKPTPEKPETKEKPSDKPNTPFPTQAKVLSDEVAQDIMGQLNDDDTNIQLEGVKQFVSILQHDPNILSNPQYREQAEALICNILDAPKAIVRHPLLLQMMDNFNAPTPKIMEKLELLKYKPDMFGIGQGFVSQVLETLRGKATVSNEEQSTQRQKYREMRKEASKISPFPGLAPFMKNISPNQLAALAPFFNKQPVPAGIPGQQLNVVSSGGPS